jgi:hypothetical protein
LEGEGGQFNVQQRELQTTSCRAPQSTNLTQDRGQRGGIFGSLTPTTHLAWSLPDLLTCLPACLSACLPACLLACLPACLPASTGLGLFSPQKPPPRETHRRTHSPEATTVGYRSHHHSLSFSSCCCCCSQSPFLSPSLVYSTQRRTIASALLSSVALRTATLTPSS